MILAVLVHEADIQDDDGAKLLLAPLKGVFPRLSLIWADSRYKCNGLPDWVKAELGWTVEIVTRAGQRQAAAWNRRRLSHAASRCCLALGGGTHLCLVGHLAASLEGLRTAPQQRPSLDLPRHALHHATAPGLH